MKDAIKITVSNSITAPLERVWACFTEPRHIINWNFASDDWQCPAAENNLTPGGKYKARMEAKDGSFGFDFEAIYDEVVQNKKITYTMGDGRAATTTFTVKEDGKTFVAITFDAENENPVEMQQQGWQAILDNFKKYTETT